ncbi:MAG TPA: universal stress protein [Chloroflexota bacterium]|nr:universal stress protein [Chloroflexota bacterium]
MASVVLVPFDGGPAAQAALHSAASTARRDDALVIALYVALIPRQLPLSADLPWLAREVSRVQLLAEPIVREAGANAWVEWVRARELPSAISSVAEELAASRILLGVHRSPKQPPWLRHWSLPGRLQRLAPCLVQVCDFKGVEAVRARQSSEALT